MKEPKISIVTVCFNSEKYIEQTIQSVVMQTYPNIEYIVVDGASTDNTLNIIKKYESKVSKWISEQDKGIGNAMNKGLSMVTGDFVLFLHSDDYLIDNLVLQKSASFFSDDYDIFAFSIYLDFGSWVKLVHPRKFNWIINFQGGYWHQGVFCRTDLFKRIGNYEISIKVPMDYDFFLRAYRNNTKDKIIKIPSSVMRVIGASSKTDWSSLRARFKERRIIHDKYCNSILLKLAYPIFWTLFLTYRWLRMHVSKVP